MAYPTIRDTATTVDVGDYYTHDITLPSSITPGDFLLVLFNIDGDHDDCTLIGDNWFLYHTDTSTVNTIYFAYKIANNSDRLTINTTSLVQISAISYSIYDTAGTFETNFYYATGTNAATGAFYTHLTGTQDYLFIAFAGMYSNIIASVAPTGYSGLTTIQSDNVYGTSCSSAWRQVQTTYGTNPVVTFTSSSATYCSYGIVINPFIPDGIGLNNIGINKIEI